MASILQELSDAMAGAVESAAPGIVRVEARRRLPATGIVWSSDGLIVTSHHVVEQTENIVIGLADDVSVPATLIGRDPGTDLAVLRAEANLTPPTWANNDELKVGHLVLALGRPGEQVQATLGVVSALGEMRMSPRRGGRHGEHGGKRKRREGMSLTSSAGPIVQTDVVMYPGFSGGPLVDAGGFVRGLNTSALVRGISLTVPTVTVRKVVDALLAHGHVRRGYLGIGAQPVRLTEALSQELDQEIGLMLVSIEAGSPAEQGGLLLGDILVALDDNPVQTVDDLLLLLGSERAGAEIALNIIRGGQLMDLTLTAGERE